jgi:hypothetical protein
VLHILFRMLHTANVTYSKAFETKQQIYGTIIGMHTTSINQ